MQPAIPHREPFLFVDNEAHEEDGTAVVRARFSPDNPYIRDGGRDPVVPPLLVLEALAQAVAVAATRAYDKTQQGFLVMLRNVEFSADVRCSEPLRLRVRHTRTYSNLIRYETSAEVGAAHDARVVCQAEIMVAHAGDA